MKLKLCDFKHLIKTALEEDIGEEDITTDNLISPVQRIRAKIITKASGVICGLNISREVFKFLDKTCRWRAKTKDGRYVKKNKVIAEIEGRARSILTGERVALNFLQHLSGIATLTRKFLKKSKGIKIYDTRKTTPGLRVLEKYAVFCGGGANHRMTLSDEVLIKENHQIVCKKAGVPFHSAIENLRTKIPTNTTIELEIQNIRQLKEALKLKDIDVIMLDNFSYKKAKKAIKIIRNMRKDLEIELSGGINLKNISKFAGLDIDRISVGAITQSAPALDISLEIL